MSAFLSADWVLLGRQFGNHLWQSTLFAAVAGMLVLSLRNNHARLRHCLWMAASVKFLVPFSLIVSAGGHLAPLFTPRATVTRIPVAAEQIAQPFTLPDSRIVFPDAPVPRTPNSPAVVFVAVWFCGFAAILMNWIRKWRRVARIVDASTTMTGGREAEALVRVQRGDVPPLRLVSSDAKLEPGTFGIIRPILWLPKGIGDYLSDAQLEAILSHELCHARRRDNLLAAIHMVVEAVFWFHPLVWWLGTRLEEERERACDEEVLRLIDEPRAYAEGVLKVCEFYLTSPMFCAAGVSGANLKKRIEGIMANPFTRELTVGRKILLIAAASIAIGVPVGIGLVSPEPGHAQSQDRLSFEVASIKPLAPGVRLTGSMPIIDNSTFDIPGIMVRGLIEMAYDIRSEFQIDYGPWKSTWVMKDVFSVSAKLPKGTTLKNIPEMLRTLLADRFAMATHIDEKTVSGLALTLGKGGPKFSEAPPESHPSEGTGQSGMDALFGQAPRMSRIPGGLRMEHDQMTMKMLTERLAYYLHRPVGDQTGLKGQYAIRLDMETSEDVDLVASLPSAVQSLGLKLEPAKVPLHVLVIDHVERPTAN